MIFLISPVITSQEQSPLLSQEGGVGSSSEHHVCGSSHPTPSGGPWMDARPKNTKHVLDPSLVVPWKQRLCAPGPEGSYQGKSCGRPKQGFPGLEEQNLAPPSEVEFSQVGMRTPWSWWSLGA